MKFARLLSKTLTISTLLSAVRYEAGVHKPQQSLPSKQQKFQKVESLYARNINYRLVGSQIIARFQPKDSQEKSIALDSLAIAFGYEYFNETNYVVEDPYRITNRFGQKLNTPYSDLIGGSLCDSAERMPFYWDIEQCRRCKSRHYSRNHHHLKQFELLFEDSPADYRLQPGKASKFVTNLVGVKKYDRQSQTVQWEILHTFRWQLTNPLTNVSKVSILKTDVEIEQLFLKLRQVMQLDGAELATNH